jgi:hypothetical protein
MGMRRFVTGLTAGRHLVLADSGTLPEAAFVLPALDAVGLDMVIVLGALKLRHYRRFWRG